MPAPRLSSTLAACSWILTACPGVVVCRQQDDDLDQLGESVQRIGHLGLTIHEELDQQARPSGLLNRTPQTLNLCWMYMSKPYTVHWPTVNEELDQQACSSGLLKITF